MTKDTYGELEKLRTNVESAASDGDMGKLLDTTIALFELTAAIIPDELRSIRYAALEEAAKVAETWGKREAQITDTAFIPAADNGEQFASVGIATAIRALKDKPNE